MYLHVSGLRSHRLGRGPLPESIPGLSGPTCSAAPFRTQLPGSPSIRSRVSESGVLALNMTRGIGQTRGKGDGHSVQSLPRAGHRLKPSPCYCPHFADEEALRGRRSLAKLRPRVVLPTPGGCSAGPARAPARREHEGGGGKAQPWQEKGNTECCNQGTAAVTQLRAWDPCRAGP